MIAVVDYGVGNLFSLGSSLAAVGADFVITAEERVIREADKIILPGVGAFEDAITKLRACGLDKVICEEARAGKHVMGICLGMQLLFEKSHEYGLHDGLGLLRGKVISMKGLISDELKIPHIGWNKLSIKKEHPLFKYVSEGDYVYFVHSYFASDCDDSLLSTTDYGVEMCAAVAKDNVMGTQFHPEKSGKIGLGILKAFCELEYDQ